MENICTGVYFRRPEILLTLLKQLKLKQKLKLLTKTLLKQDSGINVFLCFCKIFKNICEGLLLKKETSTVTTRSEACQKFGVFCTEKQFFDF